MATRLVYSFLIILLLLVAASPLPLIGIRDLSSEFVAVGLRDDVAPPIQKRTIQKPSFCTDNQEAYEKYCADMWTDRPARLQNALFQFCPGFENKCLH